MARFEVSHRVKSWLEIRKASGNFPVNPPLDEKTLSILSQPFHYFGRGAQCYAFESEDREYILKVFQENREVTPFLAWKKMFKKKPSRPRHVIKGIDFEACLTAYHLAREETALLYIHVVPTQNIFPKVSVRATLGRRFSFLLDSCVFVLQKKVDPFRETLLRASQNGELPIYLMEFFSLIEQRVAKGIYNKDPAIASNFGFLGKKAIELDFGRYVEHPDYLRSSFQTIEKEKFIISLRKFIKREMPQELSCFEKTLAEFQGRI